ncbi:rho GTPase-activating protein 29-like, partial [Salvelinus namaycush]|uniref:Rho GTPase-activating protein 29-like n=1 Tax=Salvelinus namaycush TaxID=8040 RepID=A0A8U0U5G4_SALNM
CSLACHKKCLETLAIQCGHKKLQGRLHLFGIDFTQAAKNSPDGIPFIIRKCTSEIENRALNLKGIYRVNGAKSRVEKLCQAFENGKDLVELSDLSPHDIANVLKLYLRQLPEPLILYRYYNDFIGLAKESQRVIIEEKAAARALQDQGRPGGEQPRPGDTQPGVEGEQPPLTTSQPGGGELPKQPSIKLNRVIFKIRDLLRQLPPAHYRTLRFLTAHLHRVTEQAEENKMTASNLGIIFGPTLVKPRQTDAEVSLSSLVDYPYQALMVELLVRHFQVIFDLSSPSSSYPPTTTATVGQTSSSSYRPTTTATVGQTSSSSYPPTTTPTVGQTSSSYPPTTTSTVGQTSSSYPPTTTATVGQTSSYPPTTTATVGQTSSSYPPTTTATVGQTSPRLTPQEKEQRLSLQSTSLLDIKESAKVYKRHSSVIQSSQTLDDVREVKTDGRGPDGRGPDRRELTAGSSSSAAGSASVQRSTLVFGRPSLNLSSFTSSSTAPKVQLRPQRARILSRPISMPLERLPLPTPSQVVDRNSRNNHAAARLDPAANTIVESAEPEKQKETEKPRIGGGSRVSTYYIDTQQAVQRRPWDRKYKHYDVTPRTAMIMANLPPAGTSPGPKPGKQPTMPTQLSVSGPTSSALPSSSSFSTIFPNNPYTVSLKAGQMSRRDREETKDRPNSAAEGGGETRTSTNSPIKFRQPRILQPPPGTFYKPSGYSGTRGWPSLSTSGTTSLTKMSPTSSTVKTSSPTVKTSSPTSSTVKTSSPIVKTSSPTSPTVKTSSPTSPTVKTSSPTSPTVKTSSPTVKTSSPTSLTVKTSSPTSPTVKTSSPTSSTVKTSSPTSPTVKTSSPTSPTVKTSSPTSSTVKTSSPTSSTVKTSSPTVKTSSPTSLTVKTSSPTSPTVKTSSPTSSTVKTSSPTVKTSSPTSSTVKTSSPTSPTVKTSSPTSSTVKTSSPTSPTVKTSSPTSSTVKTSSPTSPTVKTSSPTSPTVKTSSPTSPTVKTFPTSPTVTAPLLLSSSHSSSITFSSSPMVTTTSPSPITTYTLQTSNLPTHTLQDSVDSSVSVDPEVTTSADLSPRQSPPPSSPEDPSEVIPLQQRLRPRPRPGARLQELEHREAHFV